MKVQILAAAETSQSGFTHVISIDYTDLNDAEGSTKTLDLVAPLSCPNVIKAAAWRMTNLFQGQGLGELTLDVGWESITAQNDPDGLIDNALIGAENSIASVGTGDGAAFSTLGTGYAVICEETKITALFTSLDGYLSDLSEGELYIYLTIVNLDDFRP